MAEKVIGQVERVSFKETSGGPMGVIKVGGKSASAFGDKVALLDGLKEGDAVEMEYVDSGKKSQYGKPFYNLVSLSRRADESRVSDQVSQPSPQADKPMSRDDIISRLSLLRTATELVGKLVSPVGSPADIEAVIPVLGKLAQDLADSWEVWLKS